MNVKKPTHSFLIKALAIALLIVLSAGCLLSAGVAGYFAVAADQFADTADYTESALANYTAAAFAERAMREYSYGETRLPTKGTNYRYTVKNAETGEVLATNIQAGETVSGTVATLYSMNYFEGIYHGGGYAEAVPIPVATPTPAPGAQAGTELQEVLPEAPMELLLESVLLSPMTENDVFSQQARAYGWAYANKGAALPAAIVLFTLCVALFVFLLCAAGRHSDSPSPRLGWIDRIPADVLTLVVGGIAFLLLYLAVSVVDATGNVRYWTFLALALIPPYILGMLLLIGYFMSIAARIKTRTLFSNTVIGWMIRGVVRVCRAVCRAIKTFLTSLPLLWQTVVFFIVFAFVNALCILFIKDGSFLAVLFFLAFNGAIFVLAIRVTLELNRLKQGGEAIAAGDTAHRVDTEKMMPVLKKHGDNLNAISTGIANAVEARVKSERMKTDLITNVSHDLKTPLTSIVNYVDLLKKEPLSETAAGYVDVLDRQAQRLKKLTADVVDASKASSGAMPVELAPVNAVEIMTQSLAEYTERLSAVPLTVVVDAPETPITVLADGRLLWRVFDNLLANIVKYAMPGTRVYLSAAESGCEVAVSLKNISRDQLNMSASELMERFVQGDASRAGSGSGLGLSIAKSLVELQKGRFDIAIDGDLFTARMLFRKIEQEIIK